MPLTSVTKRWPGLAVVGIVAGLVALATPALAAPADAATSPSYVEGNISNPETGQPPVPRPDTPSCVVTLASSFPSNDASGDPQNFTGTYSPPAACPGPWAKVVLDYQVSVSGRQYDRSASIAIGNTTIYFGTTEEPDPSGLSYDVQKDVTEYTPTFRRTAPFSGGIGNYADSTDTGVYVQTVTLTFYEATRAVPAPPTPDRVVGVGAADVQPGSTTADFTLPPMPHDIVRAELEVYIKGNGCDEQWFASLPTDIADRYPAADFCPNGPYREVDTTIDGIASGVTQYFPYIYSGGIVPTLWRPIPAIGTFDLTPETLDVTPLAGSLDQAGRHTVTLSVPAANDVWNLESNLLLWTASGTTEVTGGLVKDTIVPQATISVTEATPSKTTVTADTTATRSSVLEGWVDTPAGRVTTTVSQRVAYANAERATTDGLYEELTQSDVGIDTTTTSGGGQAWTARHEWSYPLHVVEDVGSYVDDNNYSLSGSVDMGRQLLDTASGTGIAPVSTWVDDTMASVGEQARSDGNLTVADGHSAETWVGTYEGGVYRNALTSDHGFITSDDSGFLTPAQAWAYKPRITVP